MKPTIRYAGRLVAVVLAVSASVLSAQELKVKSLSNPVPVVSGGDALLQVQVPPSTAMENIRVKLNGLDVTAMFRSDPTARSLMGLVSGLKLGPNAIEVYANGTGLGRPAEQLTLTNHPISGPIFSGPQQQPYICETEVFDLGPPQDEHCSVPTRVRYLYGSTAGGPLQPYDPAGPRPPDLAQTTTTEGHTLDFIVRVETGTINRAVYEIAFLHQPGTPLPDPWTKTPGWNGRLIYTFGGGVRAGYHQGRWITGGSSGQPGAGVTAEAAIGGVGRPLADGYAMASSTLNVNNISGNDVISAETAMMVKERFIEQYGPPRYTIGSGSSGGAMQQHLIAYNYPGILDGILPGLSFSDSWTFLVTNLDCALLDDAFNNSSVPWTTEEKAEVVGHRNYAYCTNNFPNWRTRIHPGNGCDPAIPPAMIFDPVSNPNGVRCTFQDNQVNTFGTDPATGYARRPLDNVGVQYGLSAFNSGAITFEQFAELNRRVGGFDINGEIVQGRMAADPAALAAVYRSGRVNMAAGLDAVPIIDNRAYLDAVGDVHDASRTLIMRARLLAANGHADNQVKWMDGPPGSPELRYMAVRTMDDWLHNITSDTAPGTAAEKVVRNKPPGTVDLCFGASGEMITDAATCDALYPPQANSRTAAGEPMTQDFMKCELKPVDPADYVPVLEPAQLQTLQAVFPQGVCDYSKPGVNAQPSVAKWLAYPAPGQLALTACADGAATLGPCLPAVDVSIVPDIINLRTTAGVVTAVLALEQGFDFSEWNMSDVSLAGVPALSGALSADGRTYIASFSKANLANLAAGNAVTVTVSGTLEKNGEQGTFVASTVARVLK